MEINLEEIISAQTRTKDVWDKAVPIIYDEETNRYDVYISDSISEPSNYDELYHKLVRAKKKDTFYLHINTPGGIIDSAFKVLSGISNTKAKVVGVLTGTVASAGTIIALSCHDLVVSKHLSWMSHNYSSGMSGKGHEMKAYQQFTDKCLNAAFREIHKGFFTDSEMTEIIEGKDIWMDEKEVMKRWKKKQNS